jgi:hypothetical protein
MAFERKSSVSHEVWNFGIFFCLPILAELTALLKIAAIAYLSTYEHTPILLPAKLGGME